MEALKGKIVWGGRRVLPSAEPVDSPDLCKLWHLKRMNIVPWDDKGTEGVEGFNV